MTAIRKELHHKTWKNLVVSTKQHTTYNSLIKEMCTYFPKTPKVLQETEFSESDDNSDDEYLFVPHQANEHGGNQPQEQVADDQTNSTDDEDEVAVQPRYNLRSKGNPPGYLKDYVSFTLIPN